MTNKKVSSKTGAIAETVLSLRIGDEIEEVREPSKFAEKVLWEVWVRDGHAERKKLATRFVEEGSKGGEQVFETFQQLMLVLQDRHQLLLNRLNDAEGRRADEIADAAHSRLTNLITLTLGGFGFCFSLVVFGVLIFSDKQNPMNVWGAVFMLACVIASSCLFVYGKFVAPKIPFPKSLNFKDS